MHFGAITKAVWLDADLDNQKPIEWRLETAARTIRTWDLSIALTTGTTDQVMMAVYEIYESVKRKEDPPSGLFPRTIPITRRILDTGSIDADIQHQSVPTTEGEVRHRVTERASCINVAALGVGISAMKPFAGMYTKHPFSKGAMNNVFQYVLDNPAVPDGICPEFAILGPADSFTT